MLREIWIAHCAEIQIPFGVAFPSKSILWVFLACSKYTSASTLYLLVINKMSINLTPFKTPKTGTGVAKLAAESVWVVIGQEFLTFQYNKDYTKLNITSFEILAHLCFIVLVSCEFN